MHQMEVSYGYTSNRTGDSHRRIRYPSCRCASLLALYLEEPPGDDGPCHRDLQNPELALGVKWGSGWNYKILFEVGAHQFPLYVLLGDYETIQEGMTGTLIWQEENMVEFIPDPE